MRLRTPVMSTGGSMRPFDEIFFPPSLYMFSAQREGYYQFIFKVQKNPWNDCVYFKWYRLILTRTQKDWEESQWIPQWTGSIASTKKLSFIWDPFHLQTYSFLVWKPLRNKYFNFVLFRNWLISIFPYVKSGAKWRNNRSSCAINCLNLFKKWS